jgi:hypothetical protein
MAFLIGGANSDSGAYQVDNSVRFNNDDSPFIHKASLGSSSSNAKKWTVSFWAKLGPGLTAHRCVFSAGEASGGEYVQINFSDEDRLQIYSSNQFGQADNTATVLRTNALYRDVSAWYHVVYAIDFTDSTEADRIKLYVNGSRVTSFAASNNIPAQNTDNDRIGANNIDHFIGKFVDSSSEYFDGYLAEFHFIDGDAKASTDFGETNDNGVWVPKKYAGSYGNNGFFLDFREPNIGNANEEAIGNIGADYSGNANHFASSGITTLDQTTDTPTNNFCTWNPLVVRGGSDDLVYTEGNTGVSSNQHATNNYTFGTQGFANGKWYWEVECETVGGEMHIGIVDSGSSTTGYPSTVRDYRSNGNKELDGGSATSFGNTYTDGDIIGVAVDLDNTSIYYSKNGTWQNSGDPESGSSKTGAAYTDISSTNFPNFVLPWVAGAGVNGGADMKAFANFGNPPFSISSGNADANGYGNFEYAVPSGFYSLCTKNLAEYG